MKRKVKKDRTQSDIHAAYLKAIDAATESGDNSWKFKSMEEFMNSPVKDTGVIRKFATGATRDTATNKPDYEGYLSPLVIKRYGEYMLKHQKLSDGTMRDSDNWQMGMDKGVYMKSMWRHMHDVWMEHRGYASREGVEDALTAVMFNCMGMLHEILKEKLCRSK